MDNITEMLKGVLEGCILEIISHEEIYGYEITRRLNALGFSDVVDGTVYTILLRLVYSDLRKINWWILQKRNQILDLHVSFIG